MIIDNIFYLQQAKKVNKTWITIVMISDMYCTYAYLFKKYQDFRIHLKERMCQVDTFLTPVQCENEKICGIMYYSLLP